MTAGLAGLVVVGIGAATALCGVGLFAMGVQGNKASLVDPVMKEPWAECTAL